MIYKKYNLPIFEDEDLADLPRFSEKTTDSIIEALDNNKGEPFRYEDFTPEQLEQLRADVNNLQHDYRGTNITAPTKQGCARINKIIGTTSKAGELQANGKYKIEVISRNGEQQDSNITYLDKPLCSLSEEATDILNLTDRKVIYKCGFYKFIGTETWVSDTTNYADYIRFVCYTSIDTAKSTLTKNNRFTDRGSQAHGEYEYVYVVADSAAVYVHILKSKLVTKDVAGFKAWLNTNNIELIYELKNELVKDVNCSNKIQQFDTETTFYNRDNAEIEVSASNNSAVAEIYEEINKIEESQKINIITGQEFATNRYRNGKRIFGRCFEVGALPNSTSKQINTGIPTSYEIDEASGKAKNQARATLFLPYPTIKFSTWPSGNTYVLEIKTSDDLSAYSGFVDVYYTKD